MQDDLSELDRAYQILGLERGATLRDADHAHQFLLRAFHPDRFEGSAYEREATKRAQEINRARDVLRAHLNGTYQPPRAERSRTKPPQTGHGRQAPRRSPGSAGAAPNSASPRPTDRPTQASSTSEPDPSPVDKPQRAAERFQSLFGLLLLAAVVCTWIAITMTTESGKRSPSSVATTAPKLEPIREFAYSVEGLALQFTDHGNGLATGTLKVQDREVPLSGTVTTREVWLRDTEQRGLYIAGEIGLRHFTGSMWAKDMRLDVELTRNNAR